MQSLAQSWLEVGSKFTVSSSSILAGNWLHYMLAECASTDRPRYTNKVDDWPPKGYGGGYSMSPQKSLQLSLLDQSSSPSAWELTLRRG